MEPNITPKQAAVLALLVAGPPKTLRVLEQELSGLMEVSGHPATYRLLQRLQAEQCVARGSGHNQAWRATVKGERELLRFYEFGDKVAAVAGRTLADG